VLLTTFVYSDISKSLIRSFVLSTNIDKEESAMARSMQATRKAKPATKATAKTKKATTKAASKNKAATKAPPKTKPATKAAVKPKPTAIKATPKTTEDDTVALGRLIGQLGDAKAQKQALKELELLIHKKKSISVPDDQIQTLFSTIEKLLPKKDKLVLSKTTSILSHLAGNGKYVPMILNTKILTLLAPLFERKEGDIVAATLETFDSISNHEQGAQAIIKDKTGPLKYLKSVFENFGGQNEQLISDALQFLSGITEGGDDAIKAIFNIDKDLFFFMVNHLDADNHTSRLPAFNAVKNSMAFADEKLIHGMIDMGVIADLCNFVGEFSDDYGVIEDTLDTLTHILEKAGTRTQEAANSINDFDFVSELQEDEDENLKEKAKYLMEKFFNNN
jgi:hypothetical protein